jgi:LPXTG-motif cell wall-anchored protein
MAVAGGLSLLAGLTGLAAADVATPSAKQTAHAKRTQSKAAAKTPTATSPAPTGTGTAPASTPAPAATTTAPSVSTTTTTALASPATTTAATRRAATKTSRGKQRHQRKTSGGIVALSVTHDGKLVGGLVHAAADITGSIVDFSFSPSTITVHVGDTVTWTNTGKQPHTATANNGSFNTGILQHGQSGSHTFTTAGTFTYFCAVHPYMKGTVVVLASTTTTNPSTTTSPSNTTGTTTPTGTTGTTTPTSSGPSLPYTGIDLGGLLLGGVLMTGAGLLLRRRSES